jgi:hypothetical protein
VLIDLAMRRAFRLVGTTIISTSQDSTLARISPAVCGMDRDDRLLGAFGYSGRRTSTALRIVANPKDADSAFVLRTTIGSGVIDTITRIRGGYGGTVDKLNWVNGRAQGGWILPALAVVKEQARVIADGWIAGTRLDPYRVDWLTHAGDLARTARLRAEPIRMTKRKREFARERMGGVSGGMADFPVEEFPPWPALDLRRYRPIRCSIVEAHSERTFTCGWKRRWRAIRGGC